MQLRVTVPPWASHVVSDRTDMDRAPQALDPTRVRSFALALPDDVYFEYAFLDAEGAMHADPERPERADNPWYPSVTAVRGPNYRPHRLAIPDPTAAQGSIERLRLDVPSGASRRATIYTPAGLRGPAPLLIAHDGTAFQRIAQLPSLLEILLGEGRVRPVRLAFLDPRTPASRRDEYGFGEAYQRDLREALVPHLLAASHATELYWIGASLGGLAALLHALHEPTRVRGLALHAPALLGTPERREFHGTTASWVCDQLGARTDMLPWRVYQEVGTLDWLHDVNRAAADLLARRVAAHRFVTRNAGHNWTFWRDGIPDALTYLLGSDGTDPAQ